MKTIEFFALGIPKGQPRPRAFARLIGGKMTARCFDAGTAEGWKTAVANAAKPHLGEKFTTPVKVSLRFDMPRPKNHFRANGTLKPGAPALYAKKPDADNLAKAVLDALTVLGAWHDDAQVVTLFVKKTYTDADTGCAVKIVELEETER